jgi:plastocyanin
MVRSGVLVVALLAALAGPASAETPAPLHGTVGPGFTISLRDAAGGGVSHLDPGVYTIHISDLAEEHDFHLLGPGVDKATEVASKEETDWTVTLVAGTYRYFCDPHSLTMKGSFTVGVLPTPTPEQKLSGAVGPGSKITFARSAKAGKTRITIRDRSAADNFHLVGPGVNKKTAVKAKATVTWTVTLRAGTYTFRSDAHAKLKGTTKVS